MAIGDETVHWVPLSYNLFGEIESGRIVRGEDRKPADEEWPIIVRWLRELLGVSSGELARLVGTDDRQVRRWIAGENLPSEPSRRLMIRLAMANLTDNEVTQLLSEDAPALRRIEFDGQVIDFEIDIGGVSVSTTGEPKMPSPSVITMRSEGKVRRLEVPMPIGQITLDGASVHDLVAWWMRGTQM